MDLTLFIILVIFIILIFYIINILNETYNDIKYIKAFFENIEKPIEKKVKKDFTEVVETIKEIFFNYLKK